MDRASIMSKKPPRIRGFHHSIGEVADVRFHNSLVDDRKHPGPHKLLSVSPFLGATCNLNCAYCYTDAGIPHKNELTPGDLKSIIDQGRALGAQTVVIAGTGEPLLDKNLMPFLQYIHNQGMTTVLYTNGTLVTPEIADRLYELDVSPLVKMNSLNEGVQDKLTRRRGSFKGIQRALRIFMERGFNKAEPTRLGIESVICKPNLSEIPEIFRWARRNNIYPHIEMMIHSGRAVHNANELDISIDEAREIFTTLSEIDRTEFGYSWIPKPPYVAGDCDMVYRNIVVDSHGNIKPCFGFVDVVGNVRETTLAKALKSPLLKKLRRLDATIQGACSTCALKSTCYGCRCEMNLCCNTFGAYKDCWMAAGRPKAPPRS